MTGRVRTAFAMLAIASAGVLGYSFYRWMHRPAPPAAVEAPPATAAKEAAPEPAESLAPTVPTMRPVFSLEHRDGPLSHVELVSTKLSVRFEAQPRITPLKVK